MLSYYVVRCLFKGEDLLPFLAWKNIIKCLKRTVCELSMCGLLLNLHFDWQRQLKKLLLISIIGIDTQVLFFLFSSVLDDPSSQTLEAYIYFFQSGSVIIYQYTGYCKDLTLLIYTKTHRVAHRSPNRQPFLGCQQW